MVEGLYGGFCETCRHMAQAARPMIENVIVPNITPKVIETMVLRDMPLGEW